jgi:hypothetical protein
LSLNRSLQPHYRLVASAAAGDRWDEHDLIAILEGVGLAAEEPDVFVVDVDVDEAAEFAGLVLDLGGERGKVLVDVGDEAGQVRGLAGELFLAVGVANEGRRENDLDRNGSLLIQFSVLSSQWKRADPPTSDDETV